jgi:hypothetical protein
MAWQAITLDRWVSVISIYLLSCLLLTNDVQYAAVPRVFPGPGLVQEVPAQALPNVLVSIDPPFLDSQLDASAEPRLCYFGLCSPT